MSAINQDDKYEFQDFVERGWVELHSGLGIVVDGHDTLFESIRNELLDKYCN